MLSCECGFEARAADEEGLVVEVQRHASDAHGMPLSRDDALLLVTRAGTPHNTESPPDQEER